jgi:hypothetical protein
MQAIRAFTQDNRLLKRVVQVFRADDYSIEKQLPLHYCTVIHTGIFRHYI